MIKPGTIVVVAILKLYRSEAHNIHFIEGLRYSDCCFNYLCGLKHTGLFYSCVIQCIFIIIIDIDVSIKLSRKNTIIKFLREMVQELFLINL